MAADEIAAIVAAGPAGMCKPCLERSYTLSPISEVAGRDATATVSLTGLGNENSLAFSVGFDPKLMALRGYSAGTGAVGASMLVNTNQLAAGRLGFALARPGGQRFAAGSNELVRLRFRLGTTASETVLTFLDTPLMREVVDDSANTLCARYSNGIVSITPLLAPFITTQPTNQAAIPGQERSFNVVVGGSAPLFYQWLFNESPVSSATNSVLTLTGIATNQNGPYRVVARNEGGSITSVVATLTVNLPPLLTDQPQSRAVSVGESVVFGVGSTGTLPLGYQWQFNNENLAEATNSTLVLTNVTVARAGTYRAIVSNVGGSATSSGATLSVAAENRLIRMVNQAVATRGTVSVPVELVGLGDENAVGFTVIFDPSRLTYRSITLNPALAAAATVLNVNTDQAVAGRLGIAISRQSGQSFPAGISQLVSVGFLAGDTSGTSMLTFGDAPIVRDIADVQGSSRPATFLDGSVNILATGPSFSRQPTGTSAALFSELTLSSQANGSVPLHYQWRRDGVDIPRATNANLTLASVLLTDAGDYSVRVTNAVGAITSDIARVTVQRVVRMDSTNGITGRTVDIPLVLLSGGGENSVGFSVRFDPARLRFREIIPGNPNVALHGNTNLAGTGLLGIVAGLASPATFGIGTQHLATIRFTAGTNAGPADLVFGDKPVARELVDNAANPIETLFQPGVTGLAHVAPVITEQPQSTNVESGTLVSLRVVANGSDPIWYQWQRNGVDLPAGTNAAFTLTSAQASDSGSYTVTLRNHGGTAVSSSAVVVITPPDTSGPTLTFPRLGTLSLSNTPTITSSGELSINATDASGVARVEFYVDGNLIGTDDNGATGYAAFWNIERTTDGPHWVSFQTFDRRNNGSTLSNQVDVALAPPPAPTITSPAGQLVTSDPILPLSGLALKDTTVVAYRNGVATGAPAPVALNGAYQTAISLVEGTNRVQTATRNRAGEGPRSPEVIVVLNTSIPGPPNGVQVAAREGGRLQVSWVPSTTESILGYHLYRAINSFSNKVQAVRLTAAPMAETQLTDLPPSEERYFYRLTTVNQAGTESPLSVEASAMADRTGPQAISIQYQPAVQDPASGRIGRGLVDVTVYVNEPLLAAPFLSVVASNGVPIVVGLTDAGANVFRGSFVVSESTASGPATAAFSARDAAGNRGTDILLGRSLLFDTAGPSVVSLTTQPAGPIRNDPDNPVDLTITARLDSPVASNTTPQFFASFSTSDPTGRAIANVVPGANNLTWIATLPLSAKAGATDERLTLGFRALDDLGNESTRIVPKNEMEVYQGNLPGLETPLGLTAKPLPGGRIELRWQAVPGAADYQVFRRAAGEVEFQPLALSAQQLSYVDQPQFDGDYRYVVASVRRENGEESLSAFSAIATATADRVSPPTPQNLALSLVSIGARSDWNYGQGPLESVSYSIYRAATGPIVNPADARLVRAGIRTNVFIDPAPSAAEPFYSVFAIDVASNASPASATDYLNIQLLPVQSLAVAQTNNLPPVVSWSRPAGTVIGHDLFLETDDGRSQLNPRGLITEGSYVDTGFNGDERRYSVEAVDSNARRSLARSLNLPRVRATLLTTAQIRRGVMNRLLYTVRNDSVRPVRNAHLILVVGGRTHVSESFDVAAGTGTNIPVIVGGYREIPDSSAPATTTLEIRPNDGERVSIVRTESIAIGDGQMIIGVQPSDFTRGGRGRVRFTLLNPGDDEIEVLTARASGSQASSDIRFTLLDAENNVLGTSPFLANSGPKIVNLPNGNSVLRLAPGEEGISPSFELPVPADAPELVYVRVEIDKVYYHSDREDRVEMQGVQTRGEVAVVDTSYTGVVSAVVPPESSGEEDILISGRAWFRRDLAPARNVPMLIKIANGGFERTDKVLTDASGNFSTLFHPLPGEPGGIYSVWAVHPDRTDRTPQQTFVLKRISVTPSLVSLRTPFNFDQPLQLTVSAGPGTFATNVQVRFRAEDQPNGVLPVGVTLQSGSAIPLLSQGQSAALNLSVRAGTNAPRDGRFHLLVTSDDARPSGWQRVAVDYHFSDANPALQWAPNFVDTGVNPGSNVTERITIGNVGLTPANGLTIRLLNEDGSAAAVWARITSPITVAEFPVGGTVPVDLNFSPPIGIVEGDYHFIVRLNAANYPQTDIGVHVAVISSEKGGAYFKVVDMFTKSDFSDGVSNALIRLEHERVESTNFTLTTSTNGEALFSNIPAGPYKYRITADKHDSVNGRLWVRPGTTVSQQVAMIYGLVSVEWEVVPVTIQDRYEIVLNATFETDVPAPVVVIEPAAVNLPPLKAGDVYLGEFSIQNHGLIRADHVSFSLPDSDGYFVYEQLAPMPTELAAGQRLRIPYRLTCKATLPSGASSASGLAANAARQAAKILAANVSPQSARPAGANDGGCLTYQTMVHCSYDYKCINGLLFPGGAASCYHYAYNGGCPGGGGGGGAIVVGGGGGGASYSRGGGGISGVPECFPDDRCHKTGQCDDKCCKRQRGTASWVDLISREYQDEIEDLKIKVPGGELAVRRQFYRNDWHWPEIARRLGFHTNSAGILNSVTRNLVPYTAADSSGTVFGYRENRIRRQPDGYRWQDKDGEWEAYDLKGLLVASGKRNLTVARYQYDNAGYLASVADANAQKIFTYTYREGHLASVLDISGRRIDYVYAGNRLASVTNAVGDIETYTYNGAGQIIQKTGVSGHSYTITYDGGGYVYSVLDSRGNGHFFQFSYDKNSRQYYAQVRSSAGQIEETRFDATGEVVESTVNGIKQQSFVRSGRTEVLTHPTGVITRREYDEFGNVTREVKPDGGVWNWDYEPIYHQLVRSVDARGAMTLLTYDANGNLTNKVEAAGTPIARTNAWVYDAQNRMVRRIDARGNMMDYVYDTADNLIHEFDPDNTPYQTAYGYDNRGNRTSLTNALGYVTRYGYDAQNRLIAETNALNYVNLYTYIGKNLFEVQTGRDGSSRGRIFRYRYDERDRRTQTIRVDDKEVEHVWETTTYDADGRVASVANALDQATTYEYNARGQRVRVSRPYSATETSDTRFVYDEHGRLRHEIDPFGVITQHDYDSSNRERMITEALGTDVQRTRERGYDLVGNLTSITYSDGANALTTSYDYDLLNRRVAIYGAREYPMAFNYDANDNLTGQTNGRGYATVYRYDQYGRRTNSVEGIGHGQPGEHAGSFEYDSLGRVVTAFDGNRNHRHYHYDALGRQTEECIPMAPTDTLPASNWWANDSIRLRRTWFNTWSQPVATSNIIGGITSTVYDTFGRRFTHTDAAGLTLTNTYNELDQLLAIGYPVVSTATPGSPPTSIRYGYHPYNAQMLVSTTDRADLTTRYTYTRRFQRATELSSWGGLTAYRIDALGRQTAVTNALNEVTQSVFDQFDQLAATIYADHIPITQERVEYRAYDHFGKMTNHWGAATYDVTYVYDLAGNQVSLTDGNGNTTRWEYDGRNRTARKIYADNSDYEYQHDANGNETSNRDAMQRTTRYEFNSYNLLVRIDYPNDPDASFGYDLAGRRVLMVDGTGTNTWSYDAANRIVTNAQLNVRHVVSYSLDNEGNRLSMKVTMLRDGNVRTTSYTYDGGGRLIAIVEPDVSELPFRYAWATNANRLASLNYPSGLQTSYRYDILGRMTQLSTLDPVEVEIARFAYGHDRSGQRTNETTLTQVEQFNYDAKRQLATALRFSLDDGPDITYDFSYDPVGNWNTTTEGTIIRRFTANNLNLYTAISNSVASSPKYDLNGNLIFDGANVYTFDETDRLSSATNGLNGVSFSYDGLGKRTGMRQNGHAGSELAALVYDGSLVIGYVSNVASNSYWVTRGLDLRMGLTALGGVGGIITIKRNEGAKEALSDSQGNVRLYYDHRLALFEKVEYSPFGKYTHSADATEAFGFGSKEQFKDFPIVDFGRRYYSTSLGRWFSRDPRGESGGINLYSYALNDPINLVDPYGEISVTVTSDTSSGNCGGATREFLFSLDNGAPPCNGWVIQKVTYSLEYTSCGQAGSQCAITDHVRDHAVFWEFWNIQGTNTKDVHPFLGANWPVPVQPDVAVQDKSQNLDRPNTKGKYSAVGEIRFYCLDPNDPIWRNCRATRPDGSCRSWLLPSVTTEPGPWGRPPSNGEKPAFREHSKSWDCCNKKCGL